MTPQPSVAGIGQVPVTVMIFTLNEAIHLPSCLGSVSWSDDLIVVDSFSTDETKHIAEQHGARFYQHKFEGFGDQRMWALANTKPKHEWILILDADERSTDELRRELADVVRSAPSTVGAFRIKRRFHFWGRWLKYSNLYPTWVVRLIRKDRVKYVNRGHAETQEVDGEILPLQSDLIDENLKGIDEWFARQNRYSTREAEYELNQEGVPVRLGDLLSRDPLTRRALIKRLATNVPFRPFLYFLYSYFGCCGFLEGRDGFIFCVMRSEFHRMIVVKKHHMRKMHGK